MILHAMVIVQDGRAKVIKILRTKFFEEDFIADNLAIDNLHRVPAIARGGGQIKNAVGGYKASSECLAGIPKNKRSSSGSRFLFVVEKRHYNLLHKRPFFE